jgi:hypothetical protein
LLRLYRRRFWGCGYVEHREAEDGDRGNDGGGSADDAGLSAASLGDIESPLL